MTSTAKKRLMKDLKEIQQNPLHTIGAVPLENDIFTWHANLKARRDSPFNGGVFHLELKFPENYPFKSPSVYLLTPLPHPHVHENRICMDLLSDYQNYFTSVDSNNNTNKNINNNNNNNNGNGNNNGNNNSFSSGWSSAYSVLTILLQLQTFLDDIEDAEEEGMNLEEILKAIPKAVQGSLKFKCPSCPHHHPNIYPEINPNKVKENNENKENSSNKIMEIAKSELVCFFSKKTFEEEILGIGLNIERTKKGAKDYIKINDICLDKISFSAFTYDSVRTGVLKTEKLSHWFPLYINESNASRAAPLCEQIISYIITGNNGSFKPEMSFSLIPKFMNAMIVKLMSNEMHASLKALEGYLVFHRWLKHFAKKYPHLAEISNTQIKNFISSEKNRTKNAIPNLGEFLPLLSLDLDYVWKDIAEFYLDECDDRNVYWTFNKYPSHFNNYKNPKFNSKLLEETLTATLVSKKLLLFHIYFLEKIARPKDKTSEELNKILDTNYGFPTEDVRNEWHLQVKEILNLDDWDDYFERVGLPCLSDFDLLARTRKSIENSERKGYHNGSSSKNNNFKNKNGSNNNYNNNNFKNNTYTKINNFNNNNNNNNNSNFNGDDNKKETVISKNDNVTTIEKGSSNNSQKKKIVVVRKNNNK